MWENTLETQNPIISPTTFIEVPAERSAAAGEPCGKEVGRGNPIVPGVPVLWCVGACEPEAHWYDHRSARQLACEVQRSGMPVARSAESRKNRIMLFALHWCRHCMSGLGPQASTPLVVTAGVALIVKLLSMENASGWVCRHKLYNTCHNSRSPSYIFLSSSQM